MSGELTYKSVKDAVQRGINAYAFAKLRGMGLATSALAEMNAVRAVFGQRAVSEAEARDGRVPARQLFSFARASCFTRLPRECRRVAGGTMAWKRTVERMDAEFTERGLYLF